MHRATGLLQGEAGKLVAVGEAACVQGAVDQWRALYHDDLRQLLVFCLQRVILIHGLVTGIQRGTEHLLVLFQLRGRIFKNQLVTGPDGHVWQRQQHTLAALNTLYFHLAAGLLKQLGQCTAIGDAVFRNVELGREDAWRGIGQRGLSFRQDTRCDQPQVDDAEAAGNHGRYEEVKHSEARQPEVGCNTYNQQIG